MSRERFGDFQLLAQQAGDMSGSLTALHERCSTWVKCGCTLSSKVAPRGSKVVGLRRTCAGLSCLTLDVFSLWRTGVHQFSMQVTLRLQCNVRLQQYSVCNTCIQVQHVTSTQVAVSRKASLSSREPREPPPRRRRDGSRRASHGSDRPCRVLVLA